MKKICVMSFLLTLCLAANVSAMDLKYKKDISSNTVTVYGETDSEVNVAMQVFKPGEDIDKIEESEDPDAMLAAVVQTKSAADGTFSLSFRYDGDSGLYKAYLSSPEWDEVELIEIPFVSSSTYTEFITILNRAAGDGEIYDAVKSNTVMFGEALDFENDDDIRAASTGLYNHIKSVSALDPGKDAYNSYVYHVFAALNALRNGNCGNLLNYSEILPESIDAGWYEHVNSNAAVDFNSRVKDANPTTVAGYETAVKNSIILSVVYKPNGNMNAYKIISEYSEYLDVSNVTEEKCTKIAGNNYKSIDALKSVLSGSTGGGTAGGGGGSSSGGSNGGSSNKNSSFTVSVSTTADVELAPPKQEPLKVTFNDIDDVAWANEAINALAGKGIINGKADGIFSPNDNVTREEFVKMAVLAFGIEETDVPCGLTDVDSNMWYAPYINAAYADGIIQGISDTHFGIGRNISRQDMAVIIAKAANITSEQSKAFNDDDMIAEYAADAVRVMGSLGIISGNEQGSFMPTENARRCEAAKIIYETLKYLNK